MLELYLGSFNILTYPKKVKTKKQKELLGSIWLERWKSEVEKISVSFIYVWLWMEKMNLYKFNHKHLLKNDVQLKKKKVANNQQKGNHPNLLKKKSCLEKKKKKKI